MALYRVWAKMTSYVYLDVEAEDEYEAVDIAEETDGGMFTEDYYGSMEAGYDGGGWEIDVDNVEKLS